MTAHADSNAWNNNKSGDIVTIMRIQPSQNFIVEPNFVPFVDNSLDLKLNGVVAYSVFIQGGNSYNRNFLNNAKLNLERSYQATAPHCAGGSILVIGELNAWNSSILTEANDILVVYPPSLRAVCE